MVVAALDVEALGLQPADIGVRQRDEAAGLKEQRPELIAVDEIAELTRAQALVHHGGKAQRTDEALNLDVVIVERQREARDEPRLHDDASRPGVRLLRLEV